MANATKTHTHKKPFSAKLLFRLGPFYTINTLLFCSFLFTVNVSNKTHAIKKILLMQPFVVDYLGHWFQIVKHISFFNEE